MSESELDNLLDATLDDLEDVPSFKAFPPGAYEVFATFEAKEINDKQAIELSLKLKAVIECSAEGEDVPKEGDTASTLFFTGTPFGRGKFKECAVPFAVFAGSRNLRDIIEAVTDVECVVITAYSKNKEDPANPYMNVKEIQVV